MVGKGQIEGHQPFSSNFDHIFSSLPEHYGPHSLDYVPLVLLVLKMIKAKKIMKAKSKAKNQFHQIFMIILAFFDHKNPIIIIFTSKSKKAATMLKTHT